MWADPRSVVITSNVSCSIVALAVVVVAVADPVAFTVRSRPARSASREVHS
jgi:hypothetical protein